MTTVRGTLRSTETVESEGTGSNIGEARAVALAGIDAERFELQQANVITSRATGESTVKAVGRSRETRQHDATGPSYDVAVRVFRETVPEGWQAQSITATN